VKCVLKEHASLAVALIQTVKQMKYAYTASAGNLDGSSDKLLSLHFSFSEFTTENMVQNHGTNGMGLLSVIRSSFWQLVFLLSAIVYHNITFITCQKSSVRQVCTNFPRSKF
jgi:hypothetical protein